MRTIGQYGACAILSIVLIVGLSMLIVGIVQNRIALILLGSIFTIVPSAIIIPVGIEYAVQCCFKKKNNATPYTGSSVNPQTDE